MSFNLPLDPDEELPDWLQDLSGDSGVPATGDDLFGDTGSSDEPEWMSAGVEDDSSPSWLDEIDSGDDYEEAPSFEADERVASSSIARGFLDPSSATDDDSEWLRGIQSKYDEADLDIGASEDFEPDEPAASSTAARNFLDPNSGEDDDSAWLAGIQSKIEEDGDVPDFYDDEEDADDGDYMDRVQALKQADEQLIPDDPTADWLTGLPSSPDDPAEAVEDFSAPPATGDVPDWLTGAVSDSPEPAPTLSEAEDPSTASVMGGIHIPDTPIEGTGSLPDWLVGLEDSSGHDLAEGADEFEAALTSAVAFTASFQENILVEEDEEEEDEDIVLAPAQLPNWLSDDEAADEIAQLPAPASPDEEEDLTLERADLPDWLQTMRPGEGSPTGSGSAAVPARLAQATGDQETIGPLAGLRDVLPAEPDVVQFGSSVPLGEELVISDAQTNFIKVLVGQLTAEERPAPPKKRDLALPQRILRWIVAAVLYLVVFAPLFANVQFAARPAPESVPLETRELFTAIDQLPPAAPVLVAFEYQPGLSGEMEAAAGAVVRHLLQRQANLILISTNPTGPVLAEHFLHKTQASEMPYLVNRCYVNLGFIAGGNAALLNLAENPQSIFPTQEDIFVDGCRQPTLADIQAIHNFAMLLVITDDPDNARGWIEQVQPRLTNPATGIVTPLAMVLSAQAKPLVFPYFQNQPRQVNGLVSGVAGGMDYETIPNQPYIANRYWDAYSAGLSITIVAIVLGGLYNLGTGFLSSRRRGDA